MQLKYGLLFTFDGVDGSGKSLTLRILRRMLSKHDIHALYTKEPAGTEVGARVRKIVLSSHISLTKLQQADLFVGARKDHLEKVIIPALARHKVVICDRYVLSNMAYQGNYERDPYYISKDDCRQLTAYRDPIYQSRLAKVIRHEIAKHGNEPKYVDRNHILLMNEQLPEYIYPSLSVYLQANPDTNVRRLRYRTGKQDKIDRALTNTDKLKHLQWQYRCALKEQGTPYLFVDADRSPYERAKYIFYKLLKQIKDAKWERR